MSKFERSAPPGPLTIYVAWHPDFTKGADYARALHDWLRKVDGGYSRSGSEIPVYYRSAPWTSTVDLTVDGEALPNVSLDAPAPKGNYDSLNFPYRPFSVNDSQLTVYIPLIEPNMVRDARWRSHLFALAAHQEENKDSLLIIPVEAGPGLSSLAPIFSGINAVRLSRWDDGPADESTTHLIRLRRHVTQVLVRHLRTSSLGGQESGRGKTLPRAIFLSHAKSDGERGVGVAESIRQEALKLGQVDTFYDSANLDWGEQWVKPMLKAVLETAAFVCILSDHYAFRPWCRRELSEARRPHEVENGSGIWAVQAAVVVDALKESWTRLPDEVGGIPIIRWQSGETAAEIVDRLFLDGLQTAIHVRYCREVKKQEEKKASSTGPTSAETHYLTWLPDAHSMLEWHGQLEHSSSTRRVIYPGHGMLPSDVEQLTRWFGEKVEFVSLDEAVDALILGDDGRPTDRSWMPLVWISIGAADSDELFALGLGHEHLVEGAYQIARPLLKQRIRLAFDDDLSGLGGLLQLLLTVASGMSGANDQPGSPDEMAWKKPWLECVCRGPQTDQLNALEGETDAIAERDALLTGRCEFIGAGGWGTASDLEERAVHTSLLIAIAGRTGGGCTVLSAIHAVLKANRPVIPLSLFGGLSRRLVAWLLMDEPEASDALKATLEGVQPDEARGELESSLVEWKVEVRKALEGRHYHGVEADDLRLLMTTDSVRSVRRLIDRGVISQLEEHH